MSSVHHARRVRRSALAAGTLALVVGSLSACSSAPSSTASATSRMSQRVTSTIRPTAPTSRATSASAVGAETPEKAAAEVARLLKDHAAAAAQPGAAGKGLREGVYVGQALEAATAQGKLVSTLSAEAKADLALSPTDPVVLAVSRTAAYPRVILAKAALAGSGGPVLLMITTPAADTSYRIAAITRMLPSATVGKFDGISSGSPVVGDGAGLAIAPDTLLSAYAAAAAYPAPAATDQPFTEDAFLAAIRKNAADQATALGRGVTLKQTHTPVATLTALYAAKGEGAYVVAVLERKDTLTEKTANALTPSKAVTILTGKSTLTKSAVLRAYEFVVVHIPASGKASVVAAADQLYAASGS